MISYISYSARFQMLNLPVGLGTSDRQVPSQTDSRRAAAARAGDAGSG